MRLWRGCARSRGESLLGLAVGLALAGVVLAGCALLAQAAWTAHRALRAELSVTHAWRAVHERLLADLRDGAVDDAQVVGRPVAYSSASEVRVVVSRGGAYRCVAWRLDSARRLQRADYVYSGGCPAPSAWRDAVTMDSRSWPVTWPLARWCAPTEQEVVLADGVSGACGGVLTVRGPDGADRARPAVRGLARAAR